MNEEQLETIKDIAHFHVDRYLEDAGQSVVSRLRGIVSAQGIDAIGIRLPRESNFKAEALELSNGNQYIVYNTAQPAEVQEHYIGHELFHLIADHPNGWDVDREEAADIYAQELLRLVKTLG